MEIFENVIFQSKPSVENKPNGTKEEGIQPEIEIQCLIFKLNECISGRLNMIRYDIATIGTLKVGWFVRKTTLLIWFLLSFSVLYCWYLRCHWDIWWIILKMWLIYQLNTEQRKEPCQLTAWWKLSCSNILMHFRRRFPCRIWRLKLDIRAVYSISM